jgi:hypothetical protein
VATTPPWIVQSSPVGASKGLPEPSGSPAWIVKSGAVNPPANTAQPAAFDMTKTGTHDDFYNAYVQGDTSKYGDAIKMQDVWVGGEGGSNQTQKIIDWEKLPNQGNTKYGRIGEQVVKVNNPEYIKNKNLISFDPVYGWITPKGNEVIEHNIVGNIMKPSNVAPALMAGMFAGAAGLTGLTGLAGSAFKAVPGIAQSAMSGNFNPINIGMNLAGAGAGALGLPSWVVPAAKTAYSVATNGFNPASLVGAGLSMGAGALGAPDWIVKTAAPLASMYIQGRG